MAIHPCTASSSCYVPGSGLLLDLLDQFDTSRSVHTNVSHGVREHSNGALRGQIVPYKGRGSKEYASGPDYTSGYPLKAGLWVISDIPSEHDRM